MNNIHYLQLMVLLIRGFSCSCSRQEAVQANPFHAELHEQMKTGRFSPLAFIRGDKILQPAGVKLLLLDDRVVCSSRSTEQEYNIEFK